MFPISGIDNGETIFILVGVKIISSEGSLTGIWLHYSEWSSVFFVISNLLSSKSVDVFVGRSEDRVSSVILLQHLDRHALNLRPIFRQAHLMSEHLDFRPQLQQPTKRSPHFDIFTGGGTVGVSSDNVLAWLGRLRGDWLMVSIFSLFCFLHLVSCLCSRLFTDVKASLLTLIVIDLASEDNFFGRHRRVYYIVFLRYNIIIIIVTIRPALRIFRHCFDC